MSSYDQPNKNRRGLVVFLLVIVAFIAVAAFNQKTDQPTGLVVPTETTTSAPARQMVTPNSLEALVNAERTNAGKQPFTTSETFDRVRAPKRITCSLKTIGHTPHPTA